jgi:uncharacterized protein (DUF2236 family)
MRSSGKAQLHFVAPGTIDALLSSIAANAPNNEEGLFGPNSISWKINRESVLFLGAGRAALLQLAHPWVAAAMSEHSSLLADPIGRFHNTFRIIFTLLFGTRDQALAASKHLYLLHTHIRGEMPERVVAYQRGSQYEANEVGALRWVYATLIETALLAYEFVRPPLSQQEREAYYQESKTMAALFAISPEMLPKDWQAFQEYNQAMWNSDMLGVGDSGRRLAEAVMTGAGSWIHPPAWYRTLTAAWMPPRFREEFDMELTVAQQSSVEQTQRRLYAIYRRLPESLRYVGPFHEAQRRIRHRPVSLWIRWSNHFWMGEPMLPFADFRNGGQTSASK